MKKKNITEALNYHLARMLCILILFIHSSCRLAIIYPQNKEKVTSPVNVEIGWSTNVDKKSTSVLLTYPDHTERDITNQFVFTPGGAHLQPENLLCLKETGQSKSYRLQVNTKFNMAFGFVSHSAKSEFEVSEGGTCQPESEEAPVEDPPAPCPEHGTIGEQMTWFKDTIVYGNKNRIERQKIDILCNDTFTYLVERDSKGTITSEKLDSRHAGSFDQIWTYRPNQYTYTRLDPNGHTLYSIIVNHQSTEANPEDIAALGALSVRAEGAQKEGRTRRITFEMGPISSYQVDSTIPLQFYERNPDTENFDLVQESYVPIYLDLHHLMEESNHLSQGKSLRNTLPPGQGALIDCPTSEQTTVRTAFWDAVDRGVSCLRRRDPDLANSYLNSLKRGNWKIVCKDLGGSFGRVPFLSLFVSPILFGNVIYFAPNAHREAGASAMARAGTIFHESLHYLLGVHQLTNSIAPLDPTDRIFGCGELCFGNENKRVCGQCLDTCSSDKRCSGLSDDCKTSPHELYYCRCKNRLFESATECATSCTIPLKCLVSRCTPRPSACNPETCK